MTAQFFEVDPRCADDDPVRAAREHIAAAALRDSPAGPVGLELEFHLVDLHEPGRRPAWAQVQALVAQLAPMPAGSRVTVEPGGQLELSTPPRPDVASAVAALQADRVELGRQLAAAGFGAAPLGSDPARPVRRVNPGGRYLAMEQHFAALGCAAAGKAMMSSTAALQINLDAGPAHRWSQRLGHIGALGPVLVALSACSPYLAGRTSGWQSMRQQTWQSIDAGRSSPVPPADPTEAWAEYALDAPVMLVRDGARLRPVTERIPLRSWLAGSPALPRPATLADVDYHLTTLFPPIRPRGYLELRCIDALPDRWWPGMVALTVTLIDDPVAADAAADWCAPVRGRWAAAARWGTRDPAIGRAARGCLDIAARRCPPQLRAELDALGELFESGNSPADELCLRIERFGPLAVLEAEARVG